MHIDSSSRKGKKGQLFTRHLLRTSYREDGKVKKKTIANLSHCSDEEISAINLALRHKKDLSQLGSLSKDVAIQQGTSFGATYVLHQIANRLGISDILGHSREGKLALWQVLARVMSQGSRLSSVRLANQHSATSILKMKSFSEDTLYRNLDWIAEHQELIEQKLFDSRRQENTDMFLYDITSSYLEGTQNELANWGYNRDKKNGKMQIVIGLLCDQNGTPLSIEVFDGSTSDCTTVSDQMKKITERWQCKTITLVGDKGMIQGPQIKEIEKSGHNFITTIAKSQITPLVVATGYQTHLIDEDLLEIVHDGYRYILRRNPVQAEKTKKNRQKLLNVLEYFINSKNEYLQEHPKAKLDIAQRKITDKIEKFKLSKSISVHLDEKKRTLSLTIYQDTLKEEAKLDGCYAMKTNVSNKTLTKEDVQKKYKALSLVEDAFRCSKTELLEMRPIHVRLESRTRGHVFVVMLAYLIVKELEKCWKELDLTAEEGVDILKAFQTVDLVVNDKEVTRKIPRPNSTTQKLFQLAQITIPQQIPTSNEVVVTRKKLGKDRK